MTTEIKRADLIRAALDGKVIEGRVPGRDWFTYDDPQWAIFSMLYRPHLEYRIKPDYSIVRWVGLKEAGAEVRATGLYRDRGAAASAIHNNFTPTKLLRLEFDADLIEVKATLEAP